MLAITFWLGFFGRIYARDDIVDGYWWVLGHPRECFNMPVHRNITWIPNIMGFYVKVEYIGSKREKRTLETTIYAQRSDNICVYDLKVPYRDLSGIKTIIIEIKAFWNKKTPIDQTLLTFDLRDTTYDNEMYWNFGEKNTFLFRLELSLDINDFPIYRNVDFLWSDVIKDISIDKPICLRVWNRPKIYNLYPNIILQQLPQFHEYSYMNISAYIDNDMEQILHQETHLVNIYQCDNYFNQQFEIRVVDSVVAVSVILWEGEWCNCRRINLIKENGLFSKKYNLKKVSSMLDVFVTSKDFKKAWEDRRKIFFLHGQKPKTKLCAVSSGQDKRVVEIKTFKNENDRYILDSRAQTMNDRFKIAYWRTATKDEQEWCIKFKYI